MKSIVVLASGRGSNFEACAIKQLPISLVITNLPHAGVIEKAHKYQIPWCLLQWERKKHTREQYAEMLISHIGKPDLVVLAGWMLIMPKSFCEYYSGRMINLHPSLLPAYKGSTDAIADAYNNGDTVYGVTVHWVTPEVDAGEIIAQESVTVESGTSFSQISELVHGIEHRLLPATIEKIINQ